MGNGEPYGAATDDTSASQPRVQIDDPVAVEMVVREALVVAFPERDPDELLARITADDTSAGLVARACLRSLSDPDGSPSVLSTEIARLFEDPPKPEKLAIDAGLSVLVLTGLAMALAGTLEFGKETRVNKIGDDYTKMTSWHVRFKGSEKVSGILATVGEWLGF